MGRLSVAVPRTPWERMRGLIGRDELPSGRAMLFEGARSIHTFGMRFEILVVFADKALGVIETRVVPPRHFARNGEARHIVECCPTEAIEVGERLGPFVMDPAP
jgi:uncharacterized protein